MKKFAYTLAEVVITMLIISVVVAISIKLTKSKLDNVTSYTYYSAYKTLDTVVLELKANWNTTDTEYTDTAAFSDGEDNACLEGEPPESCPNGQEVHGCACESIPQTIPKTGTHFCKMFRDLVNTNDANTLLANVGECQGSDISDGTTEFPTEGASIVHPDLVLRNGMLVYNMHSNPVKLDELELSEHGLYYNSNGEEPKKVYIEESGYIVYVDIDGKSSGKSQLWDDVLPFYITMSGKVIPMYTTANGKDIGGNSKDYLMTSVYFYTDADVPQTQWVLKSVPFKEGACKSGYVNASAEFCNGETLDANCAENDKCHLQVITPVKTF